MRIVIGADHRGFELKGKLKKWLVDHGYDVVDVGADEYNKDDDYVDYAVELTHRMKVGDKGILICGSGQGMVMAANRNRHIRALLGCSIVAVRNARQDEDANVLCMAADEMNDALATDITRVFLETVFGKEARHVRRIQKLSNM